MHIIYETDLWPFTVGQDFMLGNSLFGAVKLTKNADSDKHKYYGYRTVFYASESFSLPDGSRFGKKLILFGADMSSFFHIGNKKKGIMILGTVRTQGIRDLVSNRKDVV